MNANTRRGYQGYRASPTTAGKGIIRERASWKAGVYKPNGTEYAIGLKPSEVYNPLYSAAILKHSKDKGSLYKYGYKAYKCAKCGTVIKTG